ncbi:hypothetical protein NEMBOFW57_001492 [Staphylotrichum longicolle]|uniref:Uncharacterized protein n=1 Tax=Staphylotrichum longicolle TaxID=669026 RepID=A0AAD4F660_9PEZI|nr:hypothetical protein NEMBOFW57_001492 [Staphylotrichum longicolle]
MQPNSFSHTQPIDIDRESPLTRICVQAVTASKMLQDSNHTSAETLRASRREKRRAEEQESDDEEGDSPILGPFSGPWKGVAAFFNNLNNTKSSTNPADEIDKLIQQLDDISLDDPIPSAQALRESHRERRRRENGTSQTGALEWGECALFTPARLHSDNQSLVSRT